jgi:hypothetical protein
MIRFLARMLQGVHGIIGITAPEPGDNELGFVLMWTAIILFFIGFCALLFYLMMNVF